MKKNSGKTDDTGDDVKKDDEEQSRRFVETAQKIGVDGPGKRFKEVLQNITNDRNK